MKATTVGIDLAKNVVQVHGVDERGRPVLRKQLKRNQVLPFLCEYHSMLDWDGGMLQRALLGAAAAEARTYRKADGTAVREALRQDE